MASPFYLFFYLRFSPAILARTLGSLLLIGGLYFAQHYFVDYIIALPVAFLSFALANQLLRWEGQWKAPTPKTTT